MKSEMEVTDDFEETFATNAGGYLDPSLVHLTRVKELIALYGMNTLTP